MDAFTIYKQDVEGIFGPYRQARDVPRIAMQVSRLSRAGRPLKIALFLDRQKGDLVLRAPVPGSLSEFCRRLIHCRGRVQKSFGLYLSTKVNGYADPDAPLKTLAKQQVESIASTWFPEAKFLPGLDIGSLWVDAPYGAYGAAAINSEGRKDLVSLIMDVAFNVLTKSVFLVGSAGAGKSATLFKVFSKLVRSHYSNGQPVDLFPVFVPSSCLRFEEGKPWIVWDSIPGGPSHCAERLEALFQEGKLILFIDGLDEKIESIAFENPLVAAFWRAAGKNRCLVSCRDRFATICIKERSLRQVFSNNLSFIQLHEWQGSHIKELYSNLAKRFKKMSLKQEYEIFKRLGGLSVEALEKKLYLRRTAWSVWLYALCYLHDKEEPASQNEYKLLDFMVTQLIEWETSKAGNILYPDTAKGLLSHIAWEAYVRGNHGDSWQISLEDLWQTVLKHYPFFEGKRAGLFASLGRIPLLEYDGNAGSFSIDVRFAGFLAAQRFLAAVRNGNRQILEQTWRERQTYPVAIYIKQGLEALSINSKGKFFALSQDIFSELDSDYKTKHTWETLRSLRAILEDMGCLQFDKANKFLWSILNQHNKRHELIVRSTVIGLVHGHESNAMRIYIQRLRRLAKARETNRNFLLYNRGDGQTHNLGVNRLLGLKILSWERTCDWLLGIFSEGCLRDELPLYLYSLCDLIKTHGLGPFGHGKAKKTTDATPNIRKHRLKQWLSSLEESLDNQKSTLEYELFQNLKKLTKDTLKGV